MKHQGPPSVSPGYENRKVRMASLSPESSPKNRSRRGAGVRSKGRGFGAAATKWDIYPLVICYIPSGKLTQLWKITIFNGKINYKWPFSIAMLNYQRVAIENGRL